GCQFAGMIDVPIYPTLTPSQAQYILNDSGARVLLIPNQEKLVEMREALSNCPNLSHVVLFDGPDSGDWLTLTQLEQHGRALLNEQPDLIAHLSGQIGADDLAPIIYTSGTTGEPKGVMLTHANIISNLTDCAGYFEFGPDDSALSVLPLSHI